MTEEEQIEDENQKKYNEQVGILKEKVVKFFEEEIMKIDLCIDDIEEIAPTLLKGLIGIYKSQSEEWKEVVKAREVFGNKSIKDLTVKEFKPDAREN